MMFNCVFVTFSCGILGQVWYLIVSIPDLCHLSHFETLQIGGIEEYLFIFLQNVKTTQSVVVY